MKYELAEDKLALLYPVKDFAALYKFILHYITCRHVL